MIMNVGSEVGKEGVEREDGGAGVGWVVEVGEVVEVVEVVEVEGVRRDGDGDGDGDILGILMEKGWRRSNGLRVRGGEARGVRSIDGTSLLERDWKGEGLRWKYDG